MSKTFSSAVPIIKSWYDDLKVGDKVLAVGKSWDNDNHWSYSGIYKITKKKRHKSGCYSCWARDLHDPDSAAVEWHPMQLFKLKVKK